MNGYVSQQFYPKQPTPRQNLALEDSYFLVRLCHIHTFFDAGWLTKPGWLILGSAIQSSIRPDQELISLYQFMPLQSRKPVDLDLYLNVTDWIPSRSADWLRLKLIFTLVQETSFMSLLRQLQGGLLTTKFSLSTNQQQLSTKVSVINQQLLASLLNDSSYHEEVVMTLSFNLATMQTGYYVIAKNQCDHTWASTIQLDANGRIIPVDTANNLYKAGLTVNTRQQLRSVLLKCDSFSSDSKLQILFADPRIAPWYEHLSNTNTLINRIDSIIALLASQYHQETHCSALVLLLNVLRDRYDPVIQIRHELDELAELVATELKVKQDNTDLLKMPLQSIMAAPFSQCLYAIVEVIGLKRRGSESARTELWWKLLQISKEQAMTPLIDSEGSERRKVLEYWQMNLAQVRSLSRHEQAYLLLEIDEIIRAAHLEVERNLLPRTRGSDLSSEWQTILGVKTRKELQESVQSYQAALQLAEA